MINIRKSLLNEDYDSFRELLIEEFDKSFKQNEKIKEVIKMKQKYTKSDRLVRSVKSKIEEAKRTVEDIDIEDKEEVTEGLKRLHRQLSRMSNNRIVEKCKHRVEETDIDDEDDIDESLRTVYRYLNILSESERDDDEIDEDDDAFDDGGVDISEDDDEDDIDESDDDEDDVDESEEGDEEDLDEALYFINRAITLCEETEADDKEEIEENFSKSDRYIKRAKKLLERANVYNKSEHAIASYRKAFSLLEDAEDIEADDDNLKESCCEYITTLHKARSLMEDDADYDVDEKIKESKVREEDDDEYRDETGKKIDEDSDAKDDENDEDEKKEETNESLKSKLSESLRKFV